MNERLKPRCDQSRRQNLLAAAASTGAMLLSPSARAGASLSTPARGTKLDLDRFVAERIEAFAAKALFAGEAVALSNDVIHSVTHPLLRFTGGVHIYGGDSFDTTRSQWNPETLARAVERREHSPHV